MKSYLNVQSSSVCRWRKAFVDCFSPKVKEQHGNDVLTSGLLGWLKHCWKLCCFQAWMDGLEEYVPKTHIVIKPCRSAAAGAAKSNCIQIFWGSLRRTLLSEGKHQLLLDFTRLATNLEWCKVPHRKGVDPIFIALYLDSFKWSRSRCSVRLESVCDQLMFLKYYWNILVLKGGQATGSINSSLLLITRSTNVSFMKRFFYEKVSLLMKRKQWFKAIHRNVVVCHKPQTKLKRFWSN